MAKFQTHMLLLTPINSNVLFDFFWRLFHAWRASDSISGQFSRCSNRHPLLVQAQPLPKANRAYMTAMLLRAHFRYGFRLFRFVIYFVLSFVSFLLSTFSLFHPLFLFSIDAFLLASSNDSTSRPFLQD